MAKPKKLSVCVLNIVIHDENKRDYKQLIKDAARQREIMAFNKTHAASLVWTSEQRHEEQNYLTGVIYKFVNVEPPYFDTDKSEVVLDREGHPLDIVPRHIKANTKEVTFCLLEEVHRIFVDTRYISPKMARSFFEDIFHREAIVEKYGSIDVNLHTEIKAIENMLSIFALKKLTVKLCRPNPIGMNRFDEEILQELEDQGAENLDLELRTRHNELQPNDKFKAYMYTATNHGKVNAVGRDENGMIVEQSTEESPIRETQPIGSHEPYYSALLRISKSLWDKLQAPNANK